MNVFNVYQPIWTGGFLKMNQHQKMDRIQIEVLVAKALNQNEPQPAHPHSPNPCPTRAAPNFSYHIKPARRVRQPRLMR